MEAKPQGLKRPLAEPECPATKKLRTRFTDEQNELVRSHFNLTGDSATPSLEACRDVLAAHSETFIGRTVGDVKDKARNLVLKLKKAANNI